MPHNTITFVTLDVGQERMQVGWSDRRDLVANNGTVVPWYDGLDAFDAGIQWSSVPREIDDYRISSLRMSGGSQAQGIERSEHPCSCCLLVSQIDDMVGGDLEI